jgi:hypothetical protein
MGEVDRYKPIIEFVNSRGHYAYRNSVGARGYRKFGKKGQFDISGVTKKGIRLEIEVKKDESEVLSEDQIEFKANMKRCNAIVLVVVTLGDVIAEFNARGL